ncbi:MAG: hypothetical protein WC554_13105 [Clostridia bacterium]
MPKVKHTPPSVTKEKGQRSLTVAPYINRYLSEWLQPEWMNAKIWRFVVANQPIAVICRDALISYVNSLEWKIEPRDSTQRDELKEEIKHYTRLFEFNSGYDYIQVNERVGKDLLDIPFGGVAELIRESEPSGRVIHIIPIDGGTCFPTNNYDVPVGQKFEEYPTTPPIYFPDCAVSRIFMSPRTEIKYAGWGMPPPERIYLSIALLCRADKYYVNLLTDTPESGILDLLDMSKEDAEEWLMAWRELLNGIDPQKIPVLYQHNKSAVWIPFTRNPSELQLDRGVMQYAAVCAAGYGLSLSDIGFQAVTSGGETLAGSIRQERRVKKSGQALIKGKFKVFRDKMLPPDLEFKFIDLDDETSVAVGRARLADATAASQYIQQKIFTPGEMRLQALSDGLITVSVPEEVPPDSEFPAPTLGGSAERPSMLGRPVAATAGGQGEVRQSLFEKELDRIINVEDVRLKRLIRASVVPISVELSALSATNILEDDNLKSWNDWHDEMLWGNTLADMPELTLATINNAMGDIDRAMIGDEWWTLCAESKEIAKDLHTDFDNLRISKLRSIAEMQYELGKINELPKEFADDASLSRRFKTRATKEVADIFDTLPSRIKKAVISGTRKYLSLQSLRGTMEFENFTISNENVAYVRNELMLVRNAMVEEFADIISSIINNILGEIKCLEDDQNQIQEKLK